MDINKLSVQGTEIKLKRHNNQDYLSLTDIARHADPRTDAIIQGYLRNGANLDFLATWESLHNSDFNPMIFNGIRRAERELAILQSAKAIQAVKLLK